jgi:hypothetical protein
MMEIGDLRRSSRACVVGTLLKEGSNMRPTIVVGVVFTIVTVVGFVVGCAKDEKPVGTGTETAHPERSEAPQWQQQPMYTSYGEPMKLNDDEAVPVGKVLANPAAYEGKYVRLVGNVNKVCTRKGCWLEMMDDTTGKPMFVKFTCPIEGRLIPMAAVGKPVVVEGTVMVKEISEEQARHYKEESGATPDEVAQVKGPQKQITLASPAARVARL